MQISERKEKPSGALRAFLLFSFLLSQYNHKKKINLGTNYLAGVRAKTTENKNTTSISWRKNEERLLFTHEPIWWSSHHCSSTCASSELLMRLEHQKEMEASLPEFPSFFLHTVFAKTRVWKWMSCRRVCRALKKQKHFSMLPFMAAFVPTRSQIADILHGLTASWAKDRHYFGKNVTRKLVKYFFHLSDVLAF